MNNEKILWIGNYLDKWAFNTSVRWLEEIGWKIIGYIYTKTNPFSIVIACTAESCTRPGVCIEKVNRVNCVFMTVLDAGLGGLTSGWFAHP